MNMVTLLRSFVLLVTTILHANAYVRGGRDQNTPAAEAEASDQRFDVDASYKLVGLIDCKGEEWTSSTWSGKTEWTQHSFDRPYTWEEQYRDYTTVYLADRNGRAGVTARIDLYHGRVLYCPGMSGHPCISIGNVVNIKTMDEDPPTPSPIAVPNLNAQEIGGVIGTKGEVWTSSGKQWTEHTIDKKYYWEEYLRDTQSVYLQDRNGRDGDTARIDLYEMKVFHCPKDRECSVTAIIQRVTAKDDESPPSPTPTPNASGCSRDKRVKIYVFSINGDCDEGSNGQHQLRIDGEKYFPNDPRDCTQPVDGFCKWREKQAHEIGDKTPFRTISFDPHRDLKIGTEEHDDDESLFEDPNGSTAAVLDHDDWYIETCEPYKIAVARDFYEQQKAVWCWDVSSSLGTRLEADGINVQHCSDWSEPSASFIWYLEVEPVPL